MEPIYQEILDESIRRLLIHKSAVDSYEEDFRNLPAIRTKCCSWCSEGERENFIPKDLESACDAWCYHAMSKSYLNPNATGFETSLRGRWLDLIIDLNKYILTTASTNYPDDPSFQIMFLSFYTTREIADNLAQSIVATDEYYIYVIQDQRRNELVYDLQRYDCNEKDNSVVCSEIETYKEGDPYLDYYGRYNLREEEYIENELVYMTIEDVMLPRRNLYDVTLRILENMKF